MGQLSVVGAGAWGTALAIQATRSDHRVTMWGIETDVVREVREEHRNSLYLPDIALPPSITATDDPRAAVSSAELIILVPPSKHLRSVSKGLAGAIAPHAIVVVASKGIEESSLQLMSQVLDETLPEVGPERRAFLAGPSFAKEVALGLPTDVVVASSGMTAARAAQRMLHSPQFRVYTSADPIGVEVGGALKNVIAVATGACDGLRSGNNARAALITRGLAEMTRLGVALGANPLTFLGLAGIGDLVLTCTGDLSRNRTLGLKVAQGADPKTFLASQRSVAEGYFTAHAGTMLARQLQVDMPITAQVYEALHQGRPLLDAIQLLMTREHKDELLGIG